MNRQFMGVEAFRNIRTGAASGDFEPLGACSRIQPFRNGSDASSERNGAALLDGPPHGLRVARELHLEGGLVVAAGDLERAGGALRMELRERGVARVELQIDPL